MQRRSSILASGLVHLVGCLNSTSPAALLCEAFCGASPGCRSLLMFPLGLLLCGLSFIPGSPQLFGVAEFFLGTLLPFLPLSVVPLILVLVAAVPRTGRVPPPIQRGDRL